MSRGGSSFRTALISEVCGFGTGRGIDVEGKEFQGSWCTSRLPTTAPFVALM